MPWRESDLMSLRSEFVVLAAAEGANMSELCRRFEVSRKTGYKWLKRYRESGVTGICDQSRRPVHSPAQTSARVETLVLNLRTEHPAWGGRKLRARLLALGYKEIPAASTITEILRRHGCISESASQARQHFRLIVVFSARGCNFRKRGHADVSQNLPFTGVHQHASQSIVQNSWRLEYAEL